MLGGESGVVVLEAIALEDGPIQVVLDCPQVAL